MRPLLAPIGLLLTAVGCTSAHHHLPMPNLGPTERGYREALDQFVGLTSVELARQFGAPQETLNLTNQHEFWNYHRNLGTQTSSESVSTFRAGDDQSLLNMGGVKGSSATSSHSVAINIQCKTTFELNERHVVINWRFQGAGCTAHESPKGNECLRPGSMLRVTQVRSAMTPDGERIVVTTQTGERWAIPNRHVEMARAWKSSGERLAACEDSPNGAYLRSTESMRFLHGEYLGWPR